MFMWDKLGIFTPCTVSGWFAIKLKHGWTDSLFIGQFWYIAIFVILWKKVSTQVSKYYQYGTLR